MRICVRSRIPMMCPSTITSSPARSLRMSSSDAGNVSRCVAMSLGLAIEVDGAVRADVRRRAAGGPALVVDGDRVEGHVRVGVLDVAVQDGDVAAEAHRTDPGLVQELVELVLELGYERIRIAGADR